MSPSVLHSVIRASAQVSVCWEEFKKSSVQNTCLNSLPFLAYRYSFKYTLSGDRVTDDNPNDDKPKYLHAIQQGSIPTNPSHVFGNRLGDSCQPASLRAWRAAEQRSGGSRLGTM